MIVAVPRYTRGKTIPDLRLTAQENGKVAREVRSKDSRRKTHVEVNRSPLISSISDHLNGTRIIRRVSLRIAREKAENFIANHF